MEETKLLYNANADSKNKEFDAFGRTLSDKMLFILAVSILTVNLRFRINCI